MHRSLSRAVNAALLVSAISSLLFRADAEAATYMVRDVGKGVAETVTNLGYVTAVGDRVYLSGRTTSLGYELYGNEGTGTSPALIRDINWGSGNSSPYDLADMNGVLYFRASDSSAGNELWLSDGTGGGTILVKDIRPGSLDSYPTQFMCAGSVVYFVANDGVTGAELWTTDGTEAGTFLLKDIFPGSTTSAVTNQTDLNGTLMFVATDDVNGAELWRSDGTSAGTVMVKDIFPGIGGSAPDELAAIGGVLYFKANDVVAGRELWKSDGTEAGTVMVKDIYSGSVSSNPAELAAYAGEVYFSAGDAANGQELWKTDGTEAGTVMVHNINPSGHSSPMALIVSGSYLYFTAIDGASGRELWRTNGTAAGTILLKDIYAGSSNSNPSQMTDSGGMLFFTATDPTNGQELWRSNGTVAGTILLKDIMTGASGSYPWYLTDVNGMLLFSATDATSGLELWRSNGTVAGTTIVADLYPGTTSGLPSTQYFATAGGYLYLIARDNVNGYELWRSDGMAAGTIRQPFGAPITDPASSNPQQLTNVNGVLIFSAVEAATGRELYKSSGTEASTVRIKDINPGTASSSPNNFTGLGGSVVFKATDVASGSELWISNGTTAGTVIVKDINPGTGHSSPSYLKRVGALVYFAATDGTAGTELWRTNGTSGGTMIVADINPGAGDSFPRHFCASGSAVLFQATDGASGVELWRTNGTAGGTAMVMDIEPGAADSLPVEFVDIAGVTYFAATTTACGKELWRTDGTLSGTFMVKDIYAGTTSSEPMHLTAMDGALYFAAGSPAYGKELWKTDGTAAGTIPLKDIYAGTMQSYPEYVTEVSGMLYFSAGSSTTGRELWRSDGTGLGTTLVCDIRQTPTATYSSSPAVLTGLNGRVFFRALDGVHGSELWKSNGTEGMTVMAADVWRGETASSPNYLTMAAGSIFFAANDGAGGIELWRHVPTYEPVVTVGGVTSVPEGSLFTGSGSFVDTDADTWTATVEYGDGTGVLPLTLDGAKTFSLSHAYIDNGSYTVTVTVTDSNAEFGMSSHEVTVVNRRPSVNAGGNQALAEGEVLALAPATFTDVGLVDTHSATIDWGDASPIDDGIVDQLAGTVNGSHVYADNGSYTVVVAVIDGDGGYAADSFTATVTNTRPVMDAGPDQDVDEGDVVTLAPATFTDAGSADTHTAVIVWDDGSPGEAGLIDQLDGSIAGTHVYADDNEYSVQIRLYDDDGDSANGFVAISVANVAPVVDAGSNQPTLEGTTVLLPPATFADPGAGDTHSAIIDWGDGSSPETGAVDQGLMTVSGSHAYVDEGRYTVTLTVSDDDGGVGVATFVVVADNAAPAVAAGVDVSVTEGDLVALPPATFVDLGSADSHTASVHWGDVVSARAAVVDEAADTVTASHVFKDDGVFTVTVTVTDEDGGIGSDAFTVTVLNAAPAVIVPQDQAATAGATFALSADFTDPGADTHTALINWDDGAGQEAAVVDAIAGTISGSHMYASAGTYSVTVSVTDSDGATGTDALIVTVSDPGSGSIGPGGGSIALTAGPVSGARIDIPPEALTVDVSFDLASGVALGLAGHVTVGPSLSIVPVGTTFGRTVEITLPYDPASIPTGTPPSYIVVLASGAQVTVLDVTAVDTTNHTVTFEVDDLNAATFQAAVPVAAPVDGGGGDISGSGTVDDGSSGCSPLPVGAWRGNGATGAWLGLIALFVLSVMSRRRARATMLVVAAVAGMGLSGGRPAEAATYRVSDINTSGSGIGSDPENLTAVNGTLFFTADLPETGTELWKSDGTSAGTRLVKDIVPSYGSSTPLSLVNVNGTLFFTASDGVNGRELWMSDGTEIGTSLVKDIRPGSDSANIQSMTAMGSILYFSASDGTNGTELWRSNGTELGTFMVRDIALSGSSNPSKLTAGNGILYFSATDSTNGDELWRSDGSAGGTVLVKDIIPGSDGSHPINLAYINDELWFSAYDSDGYELWLSDGTASGTNQVKDIYLGSTSSSPAYFCRGASNYIYFAATDFAHGREVWISYGNNAQTMLSVEIVSGVSGSAPKWLTNVSGKTFGAVDPGTGYWLWRRGQGTLPVYEPESLTALGGTLFCSGVYDGFGRELRKSDGTAAGTVLVRDIYPGSGDSNPEELCAMDGWLYFSAVDGAHGRELWKTDGTLAGTVMVKDIRVGTGNASPGVLTDFSGSLIFAALSSSHGSELWKSDGTALGTSEIIDITPGPGSSGPSNQTLIDGAIFFSADDGGNGRELWISNGTAAGTSMVTEIQPGFGSSLDSSPNFASLNGRLLFTANDGDVGEELWKSDGTAPGTTLVMDINPGVTGSNLSWMTVVGSVAIFAADDVTTGRELWITDGSPGGTAMVLDINPGAAGSNPSYLTEMGGKLFFTANDGTNGQELWASNGTPGGTDILVDLDGTSGSSSPTGLVEVNGTLYFTTAVDVDGASGKELWKSDGSPSGTVMVKDINPGAGDSNPTNLTAVNGMLYFAATDGTNGVELWVSDGTDAGTTMVKDIRPGPGSSSPAVFVNVGGTLHFKADDGVCGIEPWTSDGTRDGTRLMKDINPGPSHSSPGGYVPIGSSIYFTATDASAGWELWVNIPNVLPVVDAGAKANAEEGVPFVQAGSFIDADPDTWTAEVDYGDGSSLQPLALNADHTFVLSHVYADDGLFTATVTVDDGEGVPVSDTVAVDVANLAPSITALTGDFAGNEGDAFAWTGSAIDLGDDTVTYTWDFDDGSATATGASVVHAYTNDGRFSLALTVSDEDGGLYTHSVDIVVSNLAATADDQGVITFEETGLVVMLSGTDPGSDVFAYYLLAPPANGSLAGFNQLTGQAFYVPDPNFAGTDSFTFTIFDGTVDSTPGTVSITVVGVSDAPVATDDTATTDAGMPVDVDVLANDSDADGDALSIVSISDPVGGVAIDNGDGTITYTPDADFRGSDLFSYIVTDGTGRNDTASILVTVGSGADNTAPVALGDFAVTEANTTVVTPDLLANDTDADGDTLSIVDYTLPSDGTIIDNGDGTFEYTPAAEFVGIDGFSYTISDDNGGSDSAMVLILVQSPPTVVVQAGGVANEDLGIGGDSGCAATPGRGDSWALFAVMSLLLMSSLARRRHMRPCRSGPGADGAKRQTPVSSALLSILLFIGIILPSPSARAAEMDPPPPSALEATAPVAAPVSEMQDSTLYADDLAEEGGTHRRLGIRIGLLSPGGNDGKAYDAGPEIGIFMQLGLGSSDRLLGVDLSFARLVSSDGASTSDLYGGSAAYQWNFYTAGPATVYGLGGFSVLGESARSRTDKDASALFSMDLGIGAQLGERTDARASLLLMTNSDNANSALRVSFGMMY